MKVRRHFGGIEAKINVCGGNGSVCEQQFSFSLFQIWFSELSELILNCRYKLYLKLRPFR